MLETVARLPERISGRYALFAEIASGGMATVHIGRLLGPVGFSRTVAIKRLHAQFARDPEFVTMFLDEARLAARIRHPNVIPTLDVVATHGELFLVMEYVQGESLAQLLRTMCAANGRIPLAIVRTIMSGVLHGLHAAHEAKSERGEPLGIVHRDVSPQNVLVGTDGIARILDFGIAKAIGCAHVTRDRQIKGKLSYMAPEQLHGSPVDRRVDVYASAIMLWEMLTGQRLFLAETESTTLVRVLTGDVPLPSSVEPNIPPELDRVVLGGVGRDPDSRYRSAREMALAIERSGPLATASDVGEWVEANAKANLALRTEHIMEVEQVNDLSTAAVPSHSPSHDATLAVNEVPTKVASELGSGSGLGADETRIAPAPVEDSPARAVQYSSRLTRWGRRGARAATVLGLGIVFLFFILWTASSRRPETAMAHENPPTAGKATAQSTIATSVPSEGFPSHMNSAEPAAPNPSAASVTKSESRASVARPIGAAAPKPKRTNCSPPYTVDIKGHRHYKLECL